jgi:hypothetical protein
MTTETEYRDWQITLAFKVHPGDIEGTLTEALFDAALEHAPSEAVGMVARADTDDGMVWIVFTLPNASRDFADSVAGEMSEMVREAVVSDGDACVTAA